MKCPKCQFDISEGSKFCNECGHKFGEGLATEGERKQVTVLFSDLSGYTAMSERLDPEEVKNIIGRIFGEIAQVVVKYEGSIEKFIGDAVVAFFGVPKAHEDDPVRALRAAREIHEIVNAMSHQFESKVGKPLSMHTGVNTGLVVTGEVTTEKGSLGVTGDTVNVASRLSGLAKPGEILVGEDTYHQAEGLFNFALPTPVSVKGKAEPIRACRVLSSKEEPTKTHRLSGLRAELIGRKVEMAQLQEALTDLKQGKGSIFSIVGDAGTGKSRLIEEFKASLDLNTIQWREGHSSAYSQSIPYFPLIDLLSRAWQIKEGDSPEQVRKKVETGAGFLISDRSDLIPYLGSLYSIRYPEIENVSPEYWKMKLHESIQSIVSALTRRAPAVICLEDLHWTDPSSIELLRLILKDLRLPALFLCAYRPPFNLFATHQLACLGHIYQEIRLKDLSSSEAQTMVESLLRAEHIPSELQRFIQAKVEGNPFYLEEVINALIQSETLIKDNGNWKLTRPIREANIPSTIQGVIAARLDGLERDMKRVIQEASVIGRTFLYEILKRVTELKDIIDKSLSGLERLELIRTRTIQPDLEYIFKHALTQEVVYNGLLKKERQSLHERIGLIMEQLFHDRLPEFYETLAFHYKQGQSVRKAVDYLVKSGEKGLNRYSVEESHQYFKEAFNILSNNPTKTKEEKELLIDILLKWGFVFHYRGDFKGLTNLLISNQHLAESMEDKARLEMLLGFSIGFENEKLKESYHYLSNALKVGENIKNRQIVGYACAWLSTTCAEMGLLEEAVVLGERAQEISKMFQSDQYMYLSALSGLGQAYWHKGEIRKTFAVGEALLDRGQKYSNIRCVVRGYYTMGYGHLIAGDFPSAIESFQRSIQISADPYFSQLPRLGLIYSYVAAGQFEKAEEHLQELLTYTEKLGVDMLGTPAHALLGLVTIAKGHLSKGIKKFQDAQQIWLEKQREALYAASEYMLANVYLKISRGGGEVHLPMIIKNIGFLLKNLPFAGRKAEKHFMNSIDVAQRIGAKNTLGKSYLELGLLFKTRGKKDRARECLSKAIQVFEQCEAEFYLKQAEEALASLERGK